MRLVKPNILVFFLIIILSGILYSQNDIIEFNENNWLIFNGEVVEHLGRQTLSGSAMLKDVEFENGVIEFDISVRGDRGYPGIFFRVQSRSNYEHFYIRPHRAPYYSDAIQYAPTINNVGCWQLYSGDGFTASAEIPRNEWIHIKMEIKGTQARIFLNNSDNPALVIDHLKHGFSKGGITLNGRRDGSSYFSNFKYRADNSLIFDPPEKEITPIGIIQDWEISQSYKISQIDLEKYPTNQEMDEIKWQKVSPEPSGLVNISRYITRTGNEPDCIFAKTTIVSDNEEVKEIRFGYSDAVAVFVNSKLYFTGTSAYRQRDPSFLGIIGLFDSVYPKLKKGENELFLIVAEGFGGWGFMAQDGKKVFQDKGLTKLWESEKKFATSESVLYDEKRDVLYISNFDQYNMRTPAIDQYISKVSLDGKIQDLKWIDSLNNPLGMTIYKDNLFVAERNSIAKIDLDAGKIVNKYPIKESIFLNDITIDNDGNIYLTDSRKNVIWKYSNGQSEIWLSGKEVSDPNVIYFLDDKIIFGNSDSQSIKSVNIKSKEIKEIAKFEKGFVDGFRIDNDGNYLVSLWHGILYRVTPEGNITKILDTSTPGIYSADFEYIKKKNLLIIPTFYGNTIVGYSLK